MKLQKYLDLNNLTAAAFAREIGVSRSYVTRLCRGLQRPGPDLMGLIGERTGGHVTPNDFFDLPAPVSVGTPVTEPAVEAA